MANPKDGTAYPGFSIDMKWYTRWPRAKLYQIEWLAKQLGAFAFLLDPDVEEINICLECQMKAHGLYPERIKQILGGTFR